MVKKLIIYDNTGFIIQQFEGNAREPQGGIQFMWIDVPEEKTVVSIDTTVNPHIAVFSDVPKTQEQILSQTVAQLTLQNADLQTQLQTMAKTIATMQIGG